MGFPEIGSDQSLVSRPHWIPISFLGVCPAAALILFGLVFFSVFTALAPAALIGINMPYGALLWKNIQSKGLLKRDL